MNCPSCQSDNIKKNGHIHNGKQNYICKECGRQFVENPNKKIIFDWQRELIKKLFLERISLRGICRVMDVSLTWLIFFFRQITDEIPDDLSVIRPGKSKISIELDEMRSFVGKKKNRQWIWLAIGRASGQIIGFHIGGREKEDAKKLRNRCRVSVANVPYAILISGKHTDKSFPNAVIVHPEKERDRQTVSKEQIVPCANAFPDW